MATKVFTPARLRIAGGFLVGALLIIASARGEETQGPLIGKLGWLAGCWERTNGEKRVEEQWMKPRGGTMFGMGRTVVGEKTSEFEQMQIREEAGQLVFTAKPSGQEEASFRSIEVTGTSVVFENQAHDFPQRVIYRRQEDGSLLARIEGEDGGKARGVDFPMQRVTCGDASTR
ncbi:MAG: DUF6265 family protein [Acidobacteria bacterium]|nr:DUF6265 family protein [Acidobacteriota bacterium]